MTTRFIVEATLELKDRGVYVFARSVDGVDFQVTADSTLGGVAVKPCLDIPRRVLEDGGLDLTCFAFALVDPGQLKHFSKGQSVTLEPKVGSPSNSALERARER